MTWLQELAGRIAAALGNGWQVDGTLGDSDDDWRAFLRGPNQESLFLSNTWAGTGRLHISGLYPPHTQGRVLAITVALTRPVEQIAHEIERRLLPGYRADLVKALEQARQQKEYEAGTTRTVQAIAAMFGAPPTDSHHYSGSAAVEVTGPDQVKLTLRDIGVDVLQELTERFPALFERR